MKNTIFFIILLTLVTLGHQSDGQNTITGVWEGTFMNDFEVEIAISEINANQLTGNIKMMAGPNIIQDDKLTDFVLDGQQLKFLIPDKNTPFEGTFNKEMSELSGVLIFPDSTKYDIHLKKSLTKVNQTESPVLDYQKTFQPNDLVVDLDFIYKSLLDFHPNPYQKASEDSLKKLLTHLKQKIKPSYNLDKFYTEATKLTDAVGCSHTGIRLPANFQNHALKAGDFFPFKLFFKGGKAFYINGDKRNLQIMPGDEIVSINDKSITEIIMQLFYMIPAESKNPSTKYNKLNRSFNGLFQYIDNSVEFAVQYRSEGIIKDIEIQSIKSEELESFCNDVHKGNTVEFSLMEGKRTGVLRIPSFGISNMDEYFNQLETIFTELQATNTQNLVVDLRDNPGGHPIFAAQLFSYLIHKNFTYFKRNEDIKDFEPLYNPMEPNSLNFKGDLYVFINGGCLSTTGHLISLIKYHTDAKFIGEQPGSTFRCNDFSIPLTLPTTGIELNVPRTTFETAVDGFSFNETFSIDYKINHSIEDLTSKEDSYFKVLNTIISK